MRLCLRRVMICVRICIHLYICVNTIMYTMAPLPPIYRGSPCKAAINYHGPLGRVPSTVRRREVPALQILVVGMQIWDKIQSTNSRLLHWSLGVEALYKPKSKIMESGTDGQRSRYGQSCIIPASSSPQPYQRIFLEGPTGRLS